MSVRDMRYSAATKPEPEGPSAEELQRAKEQEELNRLRAEAAERDKQIAVMQARMEQRDQDFNQFERNRSGSGVTKQEMYDAQKELDISDEELLDPSTARAAIQRIAEHVASQQTSQLAKRTGEVLGSLAEEAFESQMSRLEKEDFFEDLEPYIRDYFQAHPEELHVRGRVKDVYERLVGKNYRVLASKTSPSDEVEGGGETINSSKSRYTQSRVIDPSVNTPGPSPRPEPGGKKGKVKLDEARQQVRDKFAAVGVELDDDEWMDIEEGRVYPKRVASDIQVGIADPNVNYED